MDGFLCVILTRVIKIKMHTSIVNTFYLSGEKVIYKIIEFILLELKLHMLYIFI